MKVIIADDEQKICALINHLADWDALNMEVIAFAHDGYEAIKLVEELKPDVLITDIRMPGYNGLEVIKKIKSKLPNIQFIIISGVKEFEYAKEALHYGVVNYLLKPVNEKELMHTLKKIKERHHEQNNQINTQQKLEQMNKENQRRTRKAWLDQYLFSKDKLNFFPSIELLNKEYGYHFQPGHFQIATLKIDGLPSDELSNNHFANKVEWLLRTHLQNCYDFEHIFCNGRFVMLLNYSITYSRIRDDLHTILEEFLQEKDIFKGCSVTISLGTSDTCIGQLSKSKRSSDWALAQRIIRGTNQIITENEYEDYAHTFLIDTFNKNFLRAIEFNEVTEISALLAQFEKNLLAQPSITGVTILKICREIFELYIFALKKFQILLPDFEQLTHSFILELDNFGNARDMFQHLTDHILTSFSQIINEKNNRDSQPIALAKQYISKNFTHPITLEIISNEVGFSPAYFSTLFKSKTGENFSDYLFNIRMEEAKRQLRETQNTVSIICTNVGYSDIKHFTKGFKKHTGLKPKEYRNLYA